nr:hypothetical protein B0A51_02361 [Rachicladosporium sp. CCFEE 5018]
MPPTITPYTINIPDSALQSLKAKLESTNLPDVVDFSDDWSYGAPLSDIKRLTDHWADGFDWRTQEASINERLPQFTTKVEVEGFGDLDMHFVHQRSEVKGAIPLLFVHGWPGSFLEVEKLLPLLTKPADGGPAFHVVAPSLPNFAFSEGPSKPGFGLKQYAESMHKIMLALEYDQYVTQGGDWGFKVTRAVGHFYPKHCLASHINLVLAKKPAVSAVQEASAYTDGEKAGLARTDWFAQEGFGYNLLQSTKPSTIGFALADSPVALLAWIYEKLHDWSDDYPWTDDELLAWVCMYQFARAGPAASARIYYEVQHPKNEAKHAFATGYIPDVKLGVSIFPRDIYVPPVAWARSLGPVVFGGMHAEGGHFAAHEKPELLAGDLRKMFGKDGGASEIAQRFAV